MHMVNLARPRGFVLTTPTRKMRWIAPSVGPWIHLAVKGIPSDAPEAKDAKAWAYKSRW